MLVSPMGKTFDHVQICREFWFDLFSKSLQQKDFICFDSNLIIQIIIFYLSLSTRNLINTLLKCRKKSNWKTTRIFAHNNNYHSLLTNARYCTHDGTSCPTCVICSPKHLIHSMWFYIIQPIKRNNNLSLCQILAKLTLAKITRCAW